MNQPEKQGPPRNRTLTLSEQERAVLTKRMLRPPLPVSVRGLSDQVVFPFGQFWPCLFLLCSLGCATPGSTNSRSGSAGESQFAVATPTSNEPVTMAMRLEPSDVSAGDTVKLRARVRIAAAHQLYAPGATFVPATLNLMLPSGVEAVDDWQVSEPVKDSHGTLIYRSSMSFQRTLRVRSNAPPRALSIEGELRYQVCSDELCWPPDSLVVAAPLNIRAAVRSP